MSLSIDTLSDTEAQRLLVRFLEGNLDALPDAPSGEAVRVLLGSATEPAVTRARDLVRRSLLRRSLLHRRRSRSRRAPSARPGLVGF